MRRLLGTLVGTALALGLVAGTAMAQDADQWEGTGFTSSPGPQGATLTIALRWEARTDLVRFDTFDVTVSMPTRADSQEDCPSPYFKAAGPPAAETDAAGPPPPVYKQVAAHRDGRVFTGTFTEDLVAPCNGIFDLSAVIRTGAGSTTTVPFTVTVANSAGTPRDLGAERVDDGRVRLGWKAPGGAPHDFLGYAVDRVDEDGTVTRLAGRTTSTGLTDTTAPDEALEYRVVTLREGPRGPGTPPVESAPATVEVEGPPEPEPSSTTTERDSAANADVDADADAGAEAGGGVPDLPRPRTGTSGPRIGPAPSVTPTTLDTGFDEALPFDPDRMVGPDDAVRPDDEFASLIFDDPEGGAGLAVPGATAAVLAVWAMHLHHLNRLARRDP